MKTFSVTPLPPAAQEKSAKVSAIFDEAFTALAKLLPDSFQTQLVRQSFEQGHFHAQRALQSEAGEGTSLKASTPLQPLAAKPAAEAPASAQDPKPPRGQRG